MERIHRRNRPANPDSNEACASQGVNGRGSRGPLTANVRVATANPYHAAATLILLTAAWLFFLIFSINSLEARSATENEGGIRGSGGDGGSSLLRGTPPPNFPVDKATVDPHDLSTAREKISELRQEFYMRYGGEMAANEMLRRGLRTFEKKSANAKDALSSVRSTADRFLNSIARRDASASSSSETPKFVMAFAGYSVTVGRGNHLEQSYPFVLDRILSPLLEMPPLGIKLVVRNSAIGGIPSFPYGWCLPNFLGEDADLVSWDYGMNEGNGASGLEGYVRQALVMPKRPPLFVLLDMKRPRLELLQKYVDLEALPDPIALGGKDAVDKNLLKLPEGDRPIGLQKWDQWGAPRGAPGQSPWHPKKMEHELIGWMLAMRMLDALMVALDEMERDADWRSKILERERRGINGSAEAFLPPPVTDTSKTNAASILYGTELKTDSSNWHMNHISCRTSFLPNISGDLGSIIQSGVTKDDSDMLQSRDDSLFNGGWVMDVGKLERDTKLKVQKFGGLGYIDMKTALYGIPSSGTLKLFLPYEGHASVGDHTPASKYFDAIVLCEVNEKRGDEECDTLSDLAFRVGGAEMPKNSVARVKGVASYLKKEICIRMDIPGNAQASFKDDDAKDLGLAVEVTVTGTGVSREKGACSISHVIWENR